MQLNTRSSRSSRSQNGGSSGCSRSLRSLTTKKQGTALIVPLELQTRPPRKIKKRKLQQKRVRSLLSSSSSSSSAAVPTFIHRELSKQFGADGWFHGFVESYTAPYYRITYPEDNDEEEMTLSELLSYLYPSSAAFSSTAFSSSSSSSSSISSCSSSLSCPFSPVSHHAEEVDEVEEEVEEVAEAVWPLSLSSSLFIKGDARAVGEYALRKRFWNEYIIGTISKSYRHELDSRSLFALIDAEELRSGSAFATAFVVGGGGGGGGRGSSGILAGPSRITIMNTDEGVTSAAAKAGFGIFCGKAESLRKYMQYIYYDFCGSFYSVQSELKERVLENFDPRRSHIILFCTFCLRCGDKTHRDTKKAIKSFFKDTEFPVWSCSRFRIHETDGVRNMIVVEIHYAKIAHVMSSFAVQMGWNQSVFVSSQCYDETVSIEKSYFLMDQGMYTFPPPAFVESTIVGYNTCHDSLILQRRRRGTRKSTKKHNIAQQQQQQQEEEERIEVPWKFFSIPTGPLLYLNRPPSSEMVAELVDNAAFFASASAAASEGEEGNEGEEGGEVGEVGERTGYFSKNDQIPLGRSNHGSWKCVLSYCDQTTHFHLI